MEKIFIAILIAVPVSYNSLAFKSGISHFISKSPNQIKVITKSSTAYNMLSFKQALGRMHMDNADSTSTCW